MKKKVPVPSLSITDIAYKAYKFKKGNGASLSKDDEEALTEWASASEQHKALIDRLTQGTYSNIDEWLLERNKIVYYHHYVIFFFTNVHAEKIKRDNAIIWLMVECWYKKAIGTEVDIFREWADSSNINKAIYERFKEHIDYIEKNARKEREEEWDSETSWKDFESNYLKGFRPFINKFLRRYKMIVDKMKRRTLKSR